MLHYIHSNKHIQDANLYCKKNEPISNDDDMFIDIVNIDSSEKVNTVYFH